MRLQKWRIMGLADIALGSIRETIPAVGGAHENGLKGRRAPVLISDPISVLHDLCMLRNPQLFAIRHDVYAMHAGGAEQDEKHRRGYNRGAKGATEDEYRFECVSGWVASGATRWSSVCV